MNKKEEIINKEKERERMSKDEMIKKYNDLYINYGHCIMDVVINDAEIGHGFEYDSYFEVMEKHIEIHLVCIECKFEYIADFYGDDSAFNYLIGCGIENFFDDNNTEYNVGMDYINNYLSNDCKYEYNKSLKDKKNNNK